MKKYQERKGRPSRFKGSLDKDATSENSGRKGQFPKEKLSEKIPGAWQLLTAQSGCL